MVRSVQGSGPQRGVLVLQGSSPQGFIGALWLGLNFTLGIQSFGLEFGALGPLGL